MKSVTSLTLAAALLASCQIEGGISGEEKPNFVTNPPDLADTVQVDRITQVTTPQVDVLWVIDNSCSMNCVTGCHTGSLADNIAENFEYFIDHFQGSGMDYHIGVITSDMDDPDHNGKLVYGPTVKFIDEDTPDPMGEFDLMVRQGTSGSGQERGFGATFNAIELWGDTVNAGFYRDSGDLHTIALSNEDDDTLSNFLSQNEFIDWYGDLKPEADMRTFNAIICESVVGPTDFDHPCSSPAVAGTDYIDAAKQLGGISWDLESNDWAVLLDSLGQQATGLRREYFLSRVPVVETIVVEVELPNETILGPFLAEVDWTYEPSRNSVTFVELVPDPLSTVLIEYTVASTQVEDEAPVETAAP